MRFRSRSARAGCDGARGREPEEVGHDHVMYGLIGFQTTVNGEMYGESGYFLRPVPWGATSRIL